MHCSFDTLLHYDVLYKVTNDIVEVVAFSILLFNKFLHRRFGVRIGGSGGGGGDALAAYKLAAFEALK